MMCNFTKDTFFAWLYNMSTTANIKKKPYFEINYGFVQKYDIVVSDASNTRSLLLQNLK